MKRHNEPLWVAHPSSTIDEVIAKSRKAMSAIGHRAVNTLPYGIRPPCQGPIFRNTPLSSVATGRHYQQATGDKAQALG